MAKKKTYKASDWRYRNGTYTVVYTPFLGYKDSSWAWEVRERLPGPGVKYSPFMSPTGDRLRFETKHHAKAFLELLTVNPKKGGSDDEEEKS
jgi:hypothetical protein